MKQIICNLDCDVKAATAGASPSDYVRIPLDTFWGEEEAVGRVRPSIDAFALSFLTNQSKHTKSRTVLFTTHVSTSATTGDDELFSRDLVDRLLEALEKIPLPHLTPSEMEHLLVLIRTALEVSLGKSKVATCLTYCHTRLTNNEDHWMRTAYAISSQFAHFSSSIGEFLGGVERRHLIRRKESLHRSFESGSGIGIFYGHSTVRARRY